MVSMSGFSRFLSFLEQFPQYVDLFHFHFMNCQTNDIDYQDFKITFFTANDLLTRKGDYLKHFGSKM